jgi:hypothetical protein
MASAIARRIQWLHPVEREVYRTWRVVTARSGAVEGSKLECCMRCGSHVRTGDVGFAVRQRGTRWKDTTAGYIHRRCVPTEDFTTAGLPARRATR